MEWGEEEELGKHLFSFLSLSLFLRRNHVDMILGIWHCIYIDDCIDYECKVQTGGVKIETGNQIYSLGNHSSEASAQVLRSGLAHEHVNN